MNVKDLVFKGMDSSGYSFIRQCLFKDVWQNGAEDYNKVVKRLIEESATTSEFVEKYLSTEDFRREQCYQEMLKKYEPEKLWHYIREMFGYRSTKTESDAGALKIGVNGLFVLIPNGHGDGTMRYAVLEHDDFYASGIMHYFTIIDGKFNIYSYDCGNDILEELDGRYRVYYYEGLVALVKA